MSIAEFSYRMIEYIKTQITDSWIIVLPSGRIKGEIIQSKVLRTFLVFLRFASQFSIIWPHLVVVSICEDWI